MFAISIFLSNYDLSVYFGNESTCQMQGLLERWFHLVLWPLAIGSGVYLLRSRSFKASSMNCWVRECHDPICALENQGALYIVSASHILGLFHLLFSCYVMFAVYEFARERSGDGYIIARRGCYVMPGALL